jgi:anaerobic selenocysteine-containing dehydrogenase
MLADRLAKPTLFLNPADAETLKLEEGDAVAVALGGQEATVTTQLLLDVPLGVALLRGVRATVTNGAVVGMITKRPVLEAATV